MKTTVLCFLLCLPLLVLVCEGAKNYSDALGKSVLFYYAQKSGKLPASNPIPWRGDSALDDCVPGGFYDSGDYLKYGLPLSSALTLLGWGLIEFKEGYESAGQLDMMYDMIQWGYDWMLDAWHPANERLVVQIADPEITQDYWGRPEDMTMNRPCYRVNSNRKGSNIVASYAAALSTGSIAFRDKGDTTYADQLLNAAESLYTYAKANRGVYSESEDYQDTGDEDDLCEAAMWLYKATGDSQYQDDATQLFMDSSPLRYGELSWQDKMSACKVLVFEAQGNTALRSEIENYLNGWIQGGDVVDYTPCGLAWRTRWGSLGSAANMAFLAVIAAEQGIQPDTFRSWAVEQINYILGDNNHAGGCFSYEIGYGSKYPRHPHHAASSCPDPPADCDWDDFDSSAPNPHILRSCRGWSWCQ